MSGSDTDLDDSLNTGLKQRPVRERKVPVRYPDSESAVIKTENMASRAPASENSPVPTSTAAAPATMSSETVKHRASIQYVPSPAELPNFRGNVLAGEPPCQPGTAEGDVRQWLDMLQIHFAATGLTDDRGKIMQLVSHTHKKLGDARSMLSKYMQDDFKDITYEEVVNDLLLTYGSVTTTSFVDASRELINVILSAKPGKVNTVMNINALREASNKVATTFVDRPCYNVMQETRPIVDIIKEVIFATAASSVFSKRVITDTLLKRKEGQRIADAYSQLTHHILASDKDSYQKQSANVNRITHESKPAAASAAADFTPAAISTATAPMHGQQHKRGRNHRGRHGNRGHRGGSTNQPSYTMTNYRGGYTIPRGGQPHGAGYHPGGYSSQRNQAEYYANRYKTVHCTNFNSAGYNVKECFNESPPHQ